MWPLETDVASHESVDIAVDSLACAEFHAVLKTRVLGANAAERDIPPRGAARHVVGAEANGAIGREGGVDEDA